MEIDLDDIKLAFQWVKDVQSGEMVVTETYTYDALTFDNDYSDEDLFDIAAIINYALDGIKNRTVRVSVSNGSLISLLR